MSLPAHKRILSYDISLRAAAAHDDRQDSARHEIQKRLREHAAATEAEVRPVAEADAAWAAEPGHAEALEIIARRLDRAGGAARREPRTGPRPRFAWSASNC